MNEHLHGDTENNGLVSQLRQRMVTLRRLARYMFKNKLEMMVSDNFSLKLMNCSPFFINVPCQDWPSIWTPMLTVILVVTTKLMASTNYLSVQQMVA